MGFISQILFLEPTGFMAVNIAVPLLHAAAAAIEMKVLAPLAANTLLPMIQGALPKLDNTRVAWAVVMVAGLLHWFVFVIYAEYVSMDKYNNKCPRKDNEKVVAASGLAQRLYGAHQNAHEFFCYFGLAVTCASVLGVLDGTSAEGKEVATMAIVGLIGRVLHLVFCENTRKSVISCLFLILSSLLYICGCFQTSWTSRSSGPWPTATGSTPRCSSSPAPSSGSGPLPSGRELAAGH